MVQVRESPAPSAIAAEATFAPLPAATSAELMSYLATRATVSSANAAPFVRRAAVRWTTERRNLETKRTVAQLDRARISALRERESKCGGNKLTRFLEAGCLPTGGRANAALVDAVRKDEEMGWDVRVDLSPRRRIGAAPFSATSAKQQQLLLHEAGGLPRARTSQLQGSSETLHSPPSAAAAAAAEKKSGGPASGSGGRRKDRYEHAEMKSFISAWTPFESVGATKVKAADDGWHFQDRRGETQGPFTSVRMTGWRRRGQFEDGTLVRRGGESGEWDTIARSPFVRGFIFL